MAVRIDADDAWARIAAPSHTGDCTLMGWVRSDAAGANWSGLLCLGDATTSPPAYVMLQQNGATGGLWFDSPSFTGLNVANNSQLAFFDTSVWAVVAITFDWSANEVRGGIKVLEGSGTSVGTWEWTAAQTYSSDHLYAFLGGNAYASDDLDGAYTNLKCWSSVLTDAEIEAESNQLMPIRLSDLHAWCPLRDAAETQDLSPNGNDVTFQATPTTDTSNPPTPWADTTLSTRLVQVGQPEPLIQAFDGTVDAVNTGVDIGTGAVGPDPGGNDAGDIFLYMGANRSGVSVIGDVPAEAGTGTYTEICGEDISLGDATFRMSATIQYLISTGSGEDLEWTESGNDVEDAALARIRPPPGVTLDWANLVFVEGTQAQATWTEITTAAHAALSGRRYLSIAVAIMKIGTGSVFGDRTVQNFHDAGHESGTADGLGEHVTPLTAVYSNSSADHTFAISTRFGDFDGTPTMTASRKTNDNRSGYLAWILVPEQVTLKDCLLVVSDSGTPLSQDVKLKDEIESLGFNVTYGDDGDAEVTSGYDLVVISESCSSGTIADKYHQTTMPLLHMEPLAWDEGTTRLASANGSDNSANNDEWYYNDDTGPFTWTGQKVNTQAVMVIEHATIASAARLFKSAATFGAGFQKLAQESDSDTSVTLGVYESGAAMLDSATAQADYVLLGFGQNWPDYWTASSRTLFKDAIEWLTTTSAVTLEQAAYRFYNDDAAPGSATPLAAQDTAASTDVDTNFRLRVQIDATGDPVSQGYKLQFRRTGSSTWKDVPPS